MSIANPLVITYNAVAKNLPRINQDNYGSEYYLEEATQSFRVKIRHSKDSVPKGSVPIDRHNVELVHTVYGVPGDADSVRSCSVTIRNDKLVDVTQLGYAQTALNGLMTAGMVSDLKGWQN